MIVYTSAMDVLSGLLDGPRAHDAFVLRSLLEPPWGLRVADEAPLTLMAVVRGEAVVRLDTGERRHLVAGDVGIRCGREPYEVVDADATAPQIVIHPGQRCATPDGVELHDVMSLGVRTWGNSATGSTVVLTGTYRLDGEVSRRLLAALPPLLVVPHGGDDRLVSLLAEEVVRDAPGQQTVLDRLLDLVLIESLRRWLASQGGDAPAWFRAAGDPIVGAALRLMHDDPAHPWTVASLAGRVGVSRALFARRFTELVGEPPMTYLTSWRLALAADLLRDPDGTVTSVARQVGYGTPFALSAAFKRAHGVSPIDHRRRHDLVASAAH